MDFSLSPAQATIRETFHGFAARRIRPVAAELDADPRFPRELFAEAGALGFFGMRYPEPEGSGADVVSYVLAVEELAWGSLAVAAACTMQSLMGTVFLQRLAPPELRARLLGPALRGERVATVCMTEPNAGSDLGAITTRAEKSPSGWRLTGAKTWITSAPVADLFTVFARTGPDSLGVFLVERGASGLSVGRAIDKAGVRASLTSEVAFDETPAEGLGDPAGGLGYLKTLLAETRLMTAALALGVGRAAFEEARGYAAERRQFGKPIREHAPVAAHLADMAVDLEAARQLTRWAAWRSDQGLPNATEASMAKLAASEAAYRTCERAARILASYGFEAGHPVERYLRDVRFTLIGGGTSEILRGMIARSL